MIVEKTTKSVNINSMKNLRIRRALNQFFSEKQLKIIEKMLNFEKLSKIENEYYSRIIKPRMNAILDLQEIALILRDKL